MKYTLKLSHKGLILVAIPLAFQIVFVVTLFALISAAERENLKERHSRNVLSESNAMLRNFMDSALFLYIYGTTGEDSFLERYRQTSQQILRQVRTLRILVGVPLDKSDASERARSQVALKRLEQIGNRATELIARGSEVIGERGQGDKLIVDHKEMEAAIRDLSAEVREYVRFLERSELADPQREVRLRSILSYVLIAGVFFNIFLAIFLAHYFNRGTALRLKLLMDNTELLAQGKPLNKALQGDDEISKLDQTFHQMAEALAEAAQRKQELISMVSHDLRTPLTSMQASLTLLSEGVLGVLPQKAEAEVKIAETNISRLIGLINDLLDVDKMEAGQLRIAANPVLVRTLFDCSMEIVSAYADAQKVNLESKVQNEQCYVDQDRIIQVLVNLLSNAIKFSPPGSTVLLSCRSSPPFVEISVSDKGRGIPESDKESIFQRFRQVDIEDDKAKRGTGLGLAIAKMLVELHGGAIGVESAIGEGSRFWIELPASKEALPK